MTNQQWEVLPELTKRRNPKVHHGKTTEGILSEGPLQTITRGRSRFVATTTRTSTSRDVLSPVNCISWFCNSRSFACTSRGTSPNSYRKRMPPSAVSTSPCLSEIAPVKDPILRANSSLSNSVATKGLAFQTTSGLWRQFQE